MSIKNLFESSVFLLGAGASMEAGCYSSKAILSNLQNQIKNPSNFDHDLELQENYEEIYNFVLSTLSYQQMLKRPNPSASLDINIEDFVMVLRQIIDREFLVPAPLIGSWNNKIESWEVKKNGIFSQFLNFITKTLIHTWANCNEKKAVQLLKPIRDVLSNPDIENIDIFGLNYDLVLEKAFYSENEQLIETGFSKSIWKNSFESGSAKIRYYKLHGSLDWYFDRDREIVVKKENEEVINNPLLIFGSSYKMQSYDPFLSLLARLKERLSKAKLFVIVGYSFHDKYINNIIIQSLSEDDKLALVVDPEIEKSSKQFIQRVEGIQNSPSISELISLTRINEEKIRPIPLEAGVFYREYFGNDCKKLQDIWDEFQVSSQPFG